MTIEERFLSHVDKHGPFSPVCRSRCWLWTGATAKGYGQFQQSNRKTVRAHRWSYENWVGPIPEGLTLDHRCRVRNCVRPTHLRPMTAGANTLLGNTITADNKNKTHCSKGHPLSGDNLKVRSARLVKGKWKSASRNCLTCRRAEYQRQNAKRSRR